MSKAEIMEKVPVTLVELKSELKTISKRDEEMGFRAGKTQEYVNAVCNSTKTVHDELKKKIESLNVPRLKDIHISKILDMQPKHVNELNTILQGYALTVSKDNLSKIISAVNDVVPKKK